MVLFVLRVLSPLPPLSPRAPSALQDTHVPQQSDDLYSNSILQVATDITTTASSDPLAPIISEVPEHLRDLFRPPSKTTIFLRH